MAILTAAYRSGGRLRSRCGSRNTVTARGADPDTLVASAKAYLGALNKLMVKRQKTKPEAMVAP
jgi:hypothetical protein